MEESYILSVSEAYEEFFEDFYRGVPVLRIDSNSLDIVSRDEDFAYAKESIEEALKNAPRQGEMPFEAR